MIFCFISGKSRACATIEPVDKSLLRTGEARFAAPIGGSIWFTSLSKGDAVETKIYTNLFHNRPPAKSSDHLWQLFITGSLVVDFRNFSLRGCPVSTSSVF